MSSILHRLLSLQQIKHLAGIRSFQRGQDYSADGHVQSLVVHGGALTATVCGTENYTVRLAAEDGALDYRCSCPVGADGAFCKHCVAVALTWLDANQTGNRPAKKGRASAAATPVVNLDDLHPWLLEQPPAALAGYLLETAERDTRLREKLLRAAARATAKGIDLSAYRRSLDRATRTGGFIDYYGAGGYAEGVREAIAPLRELLTDTPGQAAAVIDLTEYALEQVEDAMENADDSNGEIGTLLGELQELHFEACRVSRPDPEELARRLFEWEIADHWDVFYNAAETYAELLGAVGLAVYRRLAKAAWEKLPALKPRAREDYGGNRFRLTSIMEALARKSGDVDALVAIKAKDLSSPYHYLQIAELYRDAKRPDDALDWAERGAKAFPRQPDFRVSEFLAEEYHKRGRHDEAIALIWRCFEGQPWINHYQRLKHHADRAKIWPAWRDRALALLRRKSKEAAGRASPKNRWSWERPADRSRLVEIFLWENNADDAWTEAQAGGCSRDLWLRLADARQRDHPADAIPIYLREAEQLIARTGNQAYDEAVGYLKKAKALYLRLDRTDEWNATLIRLRTQHKAKRNFIARATNL